MITDSDAEGLTLEGQISAPEVGNGLTRRLAAILGYNSDRFKISGALEYSKRARLSRKDVNFTQCPTNMRLTGEGTVPGSGDFIDPATGKPKCFPLGGGGVTINTLGVSPRDAQAAPGTPGTRFNRLRPNADALGGTPGYEGVSIDSRDTFDPEQEFEDLVTPAEIYTGFLQASYQTDILGNAEAYVEILGNQRKSSSLLYRQLAIDYEEGSPLIPVEFQDSVIGNPTPTTNGNRIGVRAFVGFGNLKSRQEVDFAKIGGGLRGDFFIPGWRYDAYASKSWSDGTYEQETFLTDRLAKASNIVRNPDGSFSCTTTSDPNCVAQPFLTPAVIGGDLPQAYRDYITANVVGTTEFREFVAAFNIDGPLFQLPGGEAQLSVGAEFRDSSIDDTPSIDSQNDNLFNFTSATPTRGSDSVYEGFGEIFLPLLSDVPFAHRLNINASARYTNYDSYGGDTTYKISGEWEPVRGFGIRASYGTSYRAPALFEQFLGATSGFLSGSADPCDAENQANNPIVAANCASEGLAPDFQATNGIIVFNAGGAESGLEAETSTNFSTGIVIRPDLPSALGEFSLALDYFDIQIDNGVQRIGAGNIMDRCYEDANFRAGGGLCRLVTRDPDTTQLTVNNNYVNLSTDKVRGFELNMRYANDIGPGRLILNGLVTKFQEQSSRLFADDVLDDRNGIIGRPEWVASGDISYATDRFTIRYGIEWIEGDKNETYRHFAEDVNGVVDPEIEQFLRDTYFLETDDYFLHNLSLQFRVNDKFQLTAGVRNLFDTEPPKISAFSNVQTIANAPLYSGYDYAGRSFFLTGTTRF